MVRNKIIQPYAKKFDRLIVKNDKKVNKIIFDLREVTKSTKPCHFAPAYLGGGRKPRAPLEVSPWLGH